MKELQKGLNEAYVGNRAAGNVIQRGKVIAVRAVVYDHVANEEVLIDNNPPNSVQESVTDGLATLLSYLADVEIYAQGGRPTVLIDCLSTIPIQIGHQVLVNQIHGDNQLGGVITGLALPSKPQNVQLWSEAYSGSSLISGDGTSWIVNEAIALPLGGDIEVINAAIRELSRIIGLTINNPLNRLSASGNLSPSDEVPPTKYLLIPDPETEFKTTVRITNEVMQFESELLIGEISVAIFPLTFSKTIRGSINLPGTDIGVGGSISVDTPAAYEEGPLVSRAWITLYNPQTGAAYLGQSPLNDFVVKADQIFSLNGNISVLAGPTNFQWFFTYTDLRAVNTGHSWTTTFSNLASEIGNDLEVSIYYQILSPYKLPALATLRSSLTMNGRWVFQMREINVGSAL